MLREINLGLSDSGSAGLRCKSSVECPPCVGRMAGQEVSVTGFQTQRGWDMCRSLVPCASGYAVVLGVSCRWRTQKKKAAEEHVLLLKAQNYYYFLIQKLSVFPQAFCTFQTLVRQRTKYLIILFPQVTSNTSVLCSGLKTRRGRKWRIHFSCYFSENLF